MGFLNHPPYHRTKIGGKKCWKGYVTLDPTISPLGFSPNDSGSDGCLGIRFRDKKEWCFLAYPRVSLLDSIR